MPFSALLRSRYVGHAIFWWLLLAVSAAFDTLQEGHWPLTLGQFLAKFGEADLWLGVGRVMITIYCSLWVFTRYAIARQLPLMLVQVLLLGLFDLSLRYGLQLLRYAIGYGPGLLSPSEALQKIPQQLLAGWLFVMLAFLFKQLRTQRQSEELLRANYTLELAFLRTQLNPHFLFNSINNLYGLALSEPDRTPDAILMLGQLMRYVLYESNVDYVSITQEVRYLHSYIALEKLRYEDPVYVEFTTTGDLGHLQIAPLLLICFVENAFKHGQVNDPARPVQLHLSVQAEQLTFTTRNYLLNKQKDPTGGVGLLSVRRRLALLYPQRHHLTVTGDADTFSCLLRLDAYRLTPGTPNHLRQP
jgi:two-component system LytT family sensor kinase